ncbi:RNA-binding protein [Mycobacterium sp. ITM-2017-0098]|nr:RNA-binding protein [Mycobacterium sp. ITM-2017-0098]
MRWIVDGMNVIGCRPDGWWRDRHRAMTALVDRLEAWAIVEKANVTVVFEHPPMPPITSVVITVAHAPFSAPNSADDEIVRMVGSDTHPDDIVVATSDRVLAERVRSANATVVPAERLRELIDPH